MAADSLQTSFGAWCHVRECIHGPCNASGSSRSRRCEVLCMRKFHNMLRLFHDFLRQCALERKIPILKPSWITDSYQIWLRGDDIDLEAVCSLLLSMK